MPIDDSQKWPFRATYGQGSKKSSANTRPISNTRAVRSGPSVMCIVIDANATRTE